MVSRAEIRPPVFCQRREDSAVLILVYRSRDFRFARRLLAVSVVLIFVSRPDLPSMREKAN